MGSGPQRALKIALVTALSLGATSRAAASPQDLFGYGPRTVSMGYTGPSYATGYEATYSNPAGLTGTAGQSIALGFAYNDFNLEVDGIDSELPSSRGLIIGLALPIPFGGKLEDVFTFGAGFFTPTNAVMQAEAPYAERINWPALSRSQVVALHLALGMNFDKLVPGLSFGFGVSGSANTVGRITASLDAGNQFVSRTETQLTSRFAPIVGVRYERPKFALAAVFHAETSSRIAMDIVVNDLPIQLPLLTIYALAQYDPVQFSAEASYLPTENLRLVAGLRYRRWSQYPGARTKTSIGSNTPPRPEFRDTVSPRVGVEWTHDMDETAEDGTVIAVRGGYSFEPTPAPRAEVREVIDAFGNPIPLSSVAVRAVDSNRHALTAGAGILYRLSGEDAMAFSFDLAASLQIVTERTHAIAREGETEPMSSRGLIPGFAVTMGATW